MEEALDTLDGIDLDGAREYYYLREVVFDCAFNKKTKQLPAAGIMLYCVHVQGRWCCRTILPNLPFLIRPLTSGAWRASAPPHLRSPRTRRSPAQSPAKPQGVLLADAARTQAPTCLAEASLDAALDTMPAANSAAG